VTTLVSLWTDVRRRLEAAGVELPVFDARLLLEAGAGVSRMDILTDPRRELSAEQVAAVNALAQRREAREPVSHILGRKQFWTLDFAVNADVLIPRPETEHVVQAALERLPVDQPARVLDLGVGSGAILLAILSERPLAVGVGVDVSDAALATAAANGERAGLNARITWRCAEWDAGLEGGFDVVVSNPPYIPSADIAGLQPEVARYEPRAALDGGADGLDAYRAIVPRLPHLLRPGGAFVLEVGLGQAERVAAMAREAGLQAVDIRLDLAGIQRIVLGQRSAAA
jgi:release factor glutamine methyltransferase